MGEPIRISVSHCLDCQRRRGSAFACQARFPDERITLTGAFREWSDVGESGTHTTFRSDGRCGATIAYANEASPGPIALPVGASADPDFPPPTVSG